MFQPLASVTQDEWDGGSPRITTQLGDTQEEREKEDQQNQTWQIKKTQVNLLKTPKYSTVYSQKAKLFY